MSQEDQNSGNLGSLEAFALEYCKHDVLMKGNAKYDCEPTTGVPARMKAYKQIALKLGIPIRSINGKVRHLKLTCVSKTRMLVYKYLSEGKNPEHALEHAPGWLRVLDTPFSLVQSVLAHINYTRTHEAVLPRGRPQAQTAADRFTAGLLAAVAPAPRSPRPPAAGVREYADSVNLPVEMVQVMWDRIYSSVVRKLRALSGAGDCDSNMRGLSHAEWGVADYVLLHTNDVSLLDDDSFQPKSPALDRLMLLFELMVAVRDKFEQREKIKEEREKLKAQQRLKIYGTNSEENKSEQNISEKGDDKSKSSKISNVKITINKGLDSKSSEGKVCVSGEGSSNSGSRMSEKPLNETARAWARLHMEYTKRGYSVSVVYLQRRWYSLKQLARRQILAAVRDPDCVPHALVLAVAKRFPYIVTESLSPWPDLVKAGHVFLREDIAKDRHKWYNKISLKDVPTFKEFDQLLDELNDWSDDEIKIIEKDLETIAVEASDSETETKPVKTTKKSVTSKKSKTTKKSSKPKKTIKRKKSCNKNKPLKKSTTPVKSPKQRTPLKLDLPVVKKNIYTFNNAIKDLDDKQEISNDLEILEKLDPGCAKVSIIFDDDEPLDANENQSNDNIEQIGLNNENIDNTASPVIEKKAIKIKCEQEISDNNDGHEALNSTGKKDNSLKLTFDNEDSQDSKDEIKTLTKIKEEPVNDGGNSSPNKYGTDLKNIASLLLKERLVKPKSVAKNKNKITTNDSDDDECENDESKKEFSNYVNENRNLHNNSEESGENDKTSIEKNDKDMDDEGSSSDRNGESEEINDEGGDIEEDQTNDSEEFVSDSIQAPLDEKLINLCHIVLTPLERIPLWQKNQRNQMVKCRNFSVKKLAEKVKINSTQLKKCRPYIRPQINKTNSGPRSRQKGLNVFKKDRIYLTRHLKLSRTSFSTEFWSNRNIGLLRQCKPFSINLNRVARVVKKVALPDIDEVRRINSKILTAQVAPIAVEASRIVIGGPTYRELPPNQAISGCQYNSLSDDIQRSEVTAIENTNNSSNIHVIEQRDIIKKLANIKVVSIIANEKFSVPFNTSTSSSSSTTFMNEDASKSESSTNVLVCTNRDDEEIGIDANANVDGGNDEMDIELGLSNTFLCTNRISNANDSSNDITNITLESNAVQVNSDVKNTEARQKTVEINTGSLIEENMTTCSQKHSNVLVSNCEEMDIDTNENVDTEDDLTTVNDNTYNIPRIMLERNAEHIESDSIISICKETNKDNLSNDNSKLESSVPTEKNNNESELNPNYFTDEENTTNLEPNTNIVEPIYHDEEEIDIDTNEKANAEDDSIGIEPSIPDKLTNDNFEDVTNCSSKVNTEHEMLNCKESNQSSLPVDASKPELNVVEKDKVNNNSEINDGGFDEINTNNSITSTDIDRLQKSIDDKSNSLNNQDSSQLNISVEEESNSLEISKNNISEIQTENSENENNEENIGANANSSVDISASKICYEVGKSKDETADNLSKELTEANTNSSMEIPAPNTETTNVIKKSKDVTEKVDTINGLSKENLENIECEGISKLLNADTGLKPRVQKSCDTEPNSLILNEEELKEEEDNLIEPMELDFQSKITDTLNIDDALNKLDSPEECSDLNMTIDLENSSAQKQSSEEENKEEIRRRRSSSEGSDKLIIDLKKDKEKESDLISNYCKNVSPEMNSEETNKEFDANKIIIEDVKSINNNTVEKSHEVEPELTKDCDVPASTSNLTESTLDIKSVLNNSTEEINGNNNSVESNVPLEDSIKEICVSENIPIKSSDSSKDNTVVESTTTDIKVVSENNKDSSEEAVGQSTNTVVESTAADLKEVSENNKDSSEKAIDQSTNTVVESTRTDFIPVSENNKHSTEKAIDQSTNAVVESTDTDVKAVSENNKDSSGKPSDQSTTAVDSGRLVTQDPEEMDVDTNVNISNEDDLKNIIQDLAKRIPKGIPNKEKSTGPFKRAKNVEEEHMIASEERALMHDIQTIVRCIGDVKNKKENKQAKSKYKRKKYKKSIPELEAKPEPVVPLSATEEWERQKTLNLKYFSIGKPTFEYDKSKRDNINKNKKLTKTKKPNENKNAVTDKQKEMGAKTLLQVPKADDKKDEILEISDDDDVVICGVTTNPPDTSNTKNIPKDVNKSPPVANNTNNLSKTVSKPLPVVKDLNNATKDINQAPNDNRSNKEVQSRKSIKESLKFADDFDEDNLLIDDNNTDSNDTKDTTISISDSDSNGLTDVERKPTVNVIHSVEDRLKRTLSLVKNVATQKNKLKRPAGPLSRQLAKRNKVVTENESGNTESIINSTSNIELVKVTNTHTPRAENNQTNVAPNINSNLNNSPSPNEVTNTQVNTPLQQVANIQNNQISNILQNLVSPEQINIAQSSTPLQNGGNLIYIVVQNQNAPITQNINTIGAVPNMINPLQGFNNPMQNNNFISMMPNVPPIVNNSFSYPIPSTFQQTFPPLSTNNNIVPIQNMNQGTNFLPVISNITSMGTDFSDQMPSTSQQSHNVPPQVANNNVGAMPPHIFNTGSKENGNFSQQNPSTSRQIKNEKPDNILENSTLKDLLNSADDRMIKMLNSKDLQNNITNAQNEKQNQILQSMLQKETVMPQITNIRSICEQTNSGRNQRNKNRKTVAVKDVMVAPKVTQKTSRTSNASKANLIRYEKGAEEIKKQKISTQKAIKSEDPDPDIISIELPPKSNLRPSAAEESFSIPLEIYLREESEAPLLKLEGTAPLYHVNGKLLLLTDVEIMYKYPIYWTAMRSRNIPSCTQIAFQDTSKKFTYMQNVIMMCICMKSTDRTKQCSLCKRIAVNKTDTGTKMDELNRIVVSKFASANNWEDAEKRREFLAKYEQCDYLCSRCTNGWKAKPLHVLKIGPFYYKQIGDNPLCYLRMNYRGPFCTRCGNCLESVPAPKDIKINNESYIQVYDEHIKVLFVVPNASTARCLVTKNANLYSFSAENNCFSRLHYRLESSRIVFEVERSTNEVVSPNITLNTARKCEAASGKSASKKNHRY